MYQQSPSPTSMGVRQEASPKDVVSEELRLELRSFSDVPASTEQCTPPVGGFDSSLYCLDGGNSGITSIAIGRQ